MRACPASRRGRSARRVDARARPPAHARTARGERRQLALRLPTAQQHGIGRRRRGERAAPRRPDRLRAGHRRARHGCRDPPRWPATCAGSARPTPPRRAAAGSRRRPTGPSHARPARARCARALQRALRCAGGRFGQRRADLCRGRRVVREACAVVQRFAMAALRLRDPGARQPRLHVPGARRSASTSRARAASKRCWLCAMVARNTSNSTSSAVPSCASA